MMGERLARLFMRIRSAISGSFRSQQLVIFVLNVGSNFRLGQIEINHDRIRYIIIGRQFQSTNH